MLAGENKCSLNVKFEKIYIFFCCCCFCFCSGCIVFLKRPRLKKKKKRKIFHCQQPLQGSSHTPHLPSRNSSKAQTAWINSAYRSQVESIFQREELQQQQSQLQRGLSLLPARPPARPKICQQVLPPSAVSPQGFGWSAATLYGLIYLIMLMTKVCLAASWGKSWAGGIKQTLPAIYPARSESLGFKGLAVCWKCRNNGVFKNNKKI